MTRERDDDDDDLLSAYVDGISELSLDERKRVDDLLAREPQLRAVERETRALIGSLRDLPPPGTEPDWSALERGISDAVATLEPRTWWQRVRWQVIVPSVALAMTAAILALVLQPEVDAPGNAVVPVVETPRPLELDDDIMASMPLWLDGTDLDVAMEAAELFDLEWDLDPESVPETAELLPPTDLEWVDELDDTALDRAERFLDRPDNAGKSRDPRNHPRGPS